ncbi:MAG: thioredoxin-disulfide reductase [Candidatus Marinimicrobia bacterium]|nr:thioredoxin-disulfide reductase [Candidatus Neomarinimicrobiota bacterium]|tara:strand:- start:3932 stop:4852 length:921 start_codon:yes stop_codon:yes gene_type:complete
MKRKVIIIGSGPAGLTAAIYSARANLSPLVFEGSQPGGQLTITTDVENYPGFPNGIMGPEMMEEFRKQAKRFGAECLFQTVEKVDLSKKPFSVWSNGKKHTSESIIISTGASARLLGLDSEKELMGHGVSACATCDGFFYKDKEVVVVGGGDSAMEEATFLTKFASKVTIIHRREEFRASKIMVDRAKNNSKISIKYNYIVKNILGNKNSGVESIEIENVISKKTSIFKCDGVFIAIGHVPNTKLFNNIIHLDENGYIKTLPDSTHTNINGVFACGDVQDSIYKQAVTAAGSGCMAALDAEKWLER